MSFTFHSSDQSEMALTFSVDMESPLGDRQKPRYLVEVVWNSHFSGLAKRLCFWSHQSVGIGKSSVVVPC